jgi:hypothetical protein
MTDEEKVLKVLREKVLKEAGGEIYLAKRPKGKAAVATWTGPIAPPPDFRSDEEVWVAYVDLMPGANFEHPVQYVFINPKTGSIHVVNASTPPNDLAGEFHKVELKT